MGMCDSFLGEGEVGFLLLFRCIIPRATSHFIRSPPQGGNLFCTPILPRISNLTSQISILNPIFAHARKNPHS